MRQLVLIAAALAFAATPTDLNSHEPAPHATVDLIAEAPATTIKIPWFTIDGGGASLSGAMGFHLNGTSGQADSNHLSTAEISIQGGFWQQPPSPEIFSDGFESGTTESWSQSTP